MDCVFCRIVARSAHAEILYENETAIAILDTRPIHLGHALIIPKLKLKQYPDGEMASYANRIRANIQSTV